MFVNCTRTPNCCAQFTYDRKTVVPMYGRYREIANGCRSVGELGEANDFANKSRHAFAACLSLINISLARPKLSEKSKHAV